MSEVTNAASVALDTLDAKTRSDGGNPIAAGTARIRTFAALGKAVAEHKRVAAEGKLKTCADAWYPAVDAAKAVLAPIQTEIQAMLASKPSFTAMGRIEAELQKAESPLVEKLCALRQVAESCTAVLAEGDAPAPVGLTSPATLCR